jgi:hypothetical protein
MHVLWLALAPLLALVFLVLRLRQRSLARQNAADMSTPPTAIVRLTRKQLAQAQSAEGPGETRQILFDFYSSFVEPTERVTETRLRHAMEAVFYICIF